MNQKVAGYQAWEQDPLGRLIQRLVSPTARLDLPWRGTSGTGRALFMFMVIVIILASWVGFSTILCLAVAAVAARPRPLVNENQPAKAEVPSRQEPKPEYKSVCTVS